MNNIVTIGSFLKAYREQRNLTLKQVAAKTKINLNVLNDLENDQIEKLPNITYVRGFVKNYAKTVGADSKEAIVLLNQAYDQEVVTKEANPTETKKIVSPTEESVTGISPEEAQEIKANLISFVQGMFKKKYIVPLVALIIAVLIIKSILSWIGTLVNEPGKEISATLAQSRTSEMENTQNRQIIPTPSNEPREIVVTPIEKIEVVVETPEPAKTEAIVEEIEPPKPEAIVEKIEPPKPEVALSPGELPYRSFNPAPLQTFTIVNNSPKAQDRRLLPSNIKAAAEAKKQNVYVVADGGDSWLSYKVDNQRIKRYVLKQGRRLFIKGDKVLLFIGNYNSTKVFYNNNFISAQTKTGVKSLIFPPEAAKDLVFPLFPSYKGVPYEAQEYIKRMKSRSN